MSSLDTSSWFSAELRTTTIIKKIKTTVETLFVQEIRYSLQRVDMII
jgi:hypothetical protein